MNRKPHKFCTFFLMAILILKGGVRFRERGWEISISQHSFALQVIPAQDSIFVAQAGSQSIRQLTGSMNGVACQGKMKPSPPLTSPFLRTHENTSMESIWIVTRFLLVSNRQGFLESSAPGKCFDMRFQCVMLQHTLRQQYLMKGP